MLLFASYWNSLAFHFSSCRIVSPAQTVEGSFLDHGGLVCLIRLALIVPEGRKINRHLGPSETNSVYDAAVAILKVSWPCLALSPSRTRCKRNIKRVQLWTNRSSANTTLLVFQLDTVHYLDREIPGSDRMNTPDPGNQQQLWEEIK